MLPPTARRSRSLPPLPPNPERRMQHCPARATHLALDPSERPPPRRLSGEA